MQEFRTSDRSEIWINGGYFIFRREIFDYLKEGEELVLEPFTRLIAEGQLMAYKHQGFWRSMDTLRDRQILEDMVEQGNMPWRVQFDTMVEAGAPPSPPPASRPARGRRHEGVPTGRTGSEGSVLCLGAHSDDIEIGVGGTILGWISTG